VRSVPWLRDDHVVALRDRIWRYLTPAAAVETLALDAAALLQLPEAHVLTLARLHFLLHDEVTALFRDLPALARRLTTTTAHNEERGTDRVRGSINWPATLAARSATQLPNLYVTSPAERAYQTPENELLVHVLRQIADLGSQSGWEHAATPLGQQVRTVTADARRWMSNRMLLQLDRRTPTPRSVARIRTGRARRRYERVLSVYELHERLISRLSRRALQSLIETSGLITRSDPTLFELVCTFRVIEALKETGWKVQPLHLLHGSLRLEARRGPDELTLWYQTTPSELRRESKYRATLEQHRFPEPSDLRPDLVLQKRDADGRRWLVIECKLGTRRSVEQSARAALNDLLAYRQAFDSELCANPTPYGLGIAWGEQLEAEVGQEIMLCTPDTIASALHVALG
jgi:hypothetical protein